MIEKVSKSDEILAKLRKEGKVKELNPDYTEINKAMEEVSREYKYKSAKSEQSAGDVILTNTNKQ